MIPENAKSLFSKEKHNVYLLKRDIQCKVLIVPPDCQCQNSAFVSCSLCSISSQFYPQSRLEFKISLCLFQYKKPFFSRKLPAVARTLDCQGHQETAFTADWWAVMLCSGLSRACNILNLNPSKLLKIVVEFKDCVAGPFSKKWPSPRFFHQPANPKAEHSCHCPRWQGCDHLSTKLSDRYQCLRESKSGQDCLSAKQEGAHLTHKPPVCAQSVCPPGVPQP